MFVVVTGLKGQSRRDGLARRAGGRWARTRGHAALRPFRCVWGEEGARGRRSTSVMLIPGASDVNWWRHVQVEWRSGELARGNFGAVYVGEHRLSGEPLVVKAAKAAADGLAQSLLEVERHVNWKLQDRSGELQPRRWAMFLGSARVSNLGAPPELLDAYAPTVLVWRKEGSGETLEDYLSSRPCSALSAAIGASDTAAHGASLCRSSFRIVVGELLQALTQLQAAGIMHRDVKPRNVLVVPRAEDGAPLKLIDFGSACEWGPFFKRGYRADRATCDPTYAAPEMFLSPFYPDRFDVFSVGLIGLRVLLPALRSEMRLRECVTQLRSKYQWDVTRWACDVAARAEQQPSARSASTLGVDPLPLQLSSLAQDAALLRVLSAMLRERPGYRASAAQALQLYDFS